MLSQSLFHRIGRRLSLAPAGDRILRAAKLVLPEIERAELDLSQDPSQMAGTIRIGVDDDSCYCWLPGILRQFSRAFPNIELELASAISEKPVQRLRNNEVDLAVISQPARERQVKLYELFEDELVAVLAAGHSLASKEYLQPKDFSSEMLFCCGRYAETLLYQRVLRPAGIRPRCSARRRAFTGEQRISSAERFQQRNVILLRALCRDSLVAKSPATGRNSAQSCNASQSHRSVSRVG